MIVFVLFFVIRIFLPILITDAVYLLYYKKVEDRRLFFSFKHFFFLLLISSIYIGSLFQMVLFLCPLFFIGLIGVNERLSARFKIITSIVIIGAMHLFFIPFLVFIKSNSYSYSEFSNDGDHYTLLLKKSVHRAFAVEETKNTLYIYKNKFIFYSEINNQTFDTADSDYTPNVPETYEGLKNYLKQND